MSRDRSGNSCLARRKGFVIDPAIHVGDYSSAMKSRERKEQPRNAKGGTNVWSMLSLPRIRQVGYSIADQALFVGGTFLANVMLARVQTKEEYGMFALSYSVFTFLSGLHNSAILEPYTVYASGRYRSSFPEYLRLIVRSNVIVGAMLTAVIGLSCLVISWIAPGLFSKALLGLGVTVGIILSGIFLRRVFYLQGRADFAAYTSLMFFLTVAVGLYLTTRAHVLDSFSVFLVLALGWIVAGIGFAGRLPCWGTRISFLDIEPQYWQEHWKFARWVFVSTLVFQFTTQGYYWLVAAFLSVKNVAELRTMYLLIAPVDQIFIALSFLLLPRLSAKYASGNTEGFLSLWKKYALATVVMTAVFAFAVRALGKSVMHLVYAGKFDEQVSLLFWLGLLPLVMGIGNTLTVALNAMEKPKFAFFGFLSSCLATFAFGIPLVMHYSLRGAVYGMLISGATYTTALAIAFLVSLYKSKRRDSGECAATTYDVQARGTTIVVPSTAERIGVTA
jgi:O-antigen/teichoic acid export membrane protein